MSWNLLMVNYGARAPFRDLRTPDASSVNGQWLYAVYDANCDMGSPGPPPTGPCFDAAPSYLPITVLFDATGTIVNPTVYFPFAVNIIEPSIIVKALVPPPGQTFWSGEIDASDPAVGGPPGS